MKNKKILSLLLAVTMMAGCFAGCGQEQVDSPSSESTTKSVQEEPSLFNVGELPIVNEPITLKVLTQDSNNPNYDTIDKAGLWTWLEEQTGIHFEVESYPAEELKNKLPLIMATPNEMPDLFFRCDMTEADVLTYGQNGQLLVLDDYIEQYGTNIKECFDTLDYAYGASASADGNIYSLPSFNAGYASLIYSMNSRWMENAGITEVPTTMEELYETFKALQAHGDPNGDGIKGNEIYLSFPVDNMKRVALSWVGIDCYWPWQGCLFDAKDDEVFFVPTSEEYKYLLTWMNKFYKDGMIDQEHFTQTSSERKAKEEVDLTFMSGQFFDPEMENFNGITGQFLPDPLTSEVNDTPFYTIGAPYQTAIGSVSAYTEYPEICVLLLDYLFSEEGSMAAVYGLEGVDFTVNSKDPLIITSTNPEAPKSFGELYGPTPVLVSRWKRDEWKQPLATSMKQTNSEKLEKYGKMGFQNYLKFTEEEAEKINVLSTDISLLCDDYYVGFINGTYDIEKDWDKYVETCNSMKVEELTAVYQASYNRFYDVE